MSEIAIFGGTFDPPTRAHEAIIGACLVRPEIYEVWLMPSGHREDKPYMQSDESRLTMLGLVKAYSFNNDERIVVTDFEQKLPQPSQTYQTVAALEAVNKRDNFWFVFGADSYHDMPNWSHGMQLRNKLGMLLVPRLGIELPEESEKIHHLQLDPNILNISSTQARALAGCNQLHNQVSGPVASFIKQQHFYENVLTGSL